MVAPTVSATTYNGPPLFTLPAKTPKTEVACTTCVPTSLMDKKSVGYQNAISSFVGRYNDSALDSEGFSLPRPLRAWQMKYNAAHDRLYMRVGSFLVAYDVATLISRLNSNEALTTIYRPGDVGPAGSYLSWDKYFNIEENWPQSGLDGGDWLPDFDFDDRGFVYLTEGVAWGSVKDDYARGGQFSDGFRISASNARSIVVLKASNGHYYTVVSPETGSSLVYDVTDRSTPLPAGTISRSFLKTAVAKSADGHWVAIANSGSNAIEIFTTEDFITNRPPTFSTASGQSYKGVTTDGINFYSAESASGGKLSVSMFTPTGGTITEQKFRTPYTFLPERLQFGAGYISVSGLNTTNSTNDIHVFRLSSGNLLELDLTAYTTSSNAKTDRYFPAYYSTLGVPTGYLSSIYSLIFDSLVFQKGNKTYLFVNAKGLGDVYEIKGSDSVTAANKGVTGTTNPNSAQTSTGPFYGDKLVFGSSTSAPAQMNVNWNFGNPESSDNTAASTTGADVVHQFSGLTSTSQLASPRTVTVTNVLDSSITDSQIVTLAVPSPRVGIVGQPSILFTAPNASSTAPIVTSDTWKDASDGTVEGHYSAWTIDGTTTKTLPNGTVPVGGCGTHSLIFTANYGPYGGSGSSLSSTNGALAQSINSINYQSRPFVAKVTGPTASGGADIAFTSASRITSDTSVLSPGTQFTWTWDLLNSSGVSIQTATGTSTLNAIPNFLVARASLTGLTGVKVRLSLSTTATLPGSCAALTSTSVTNDVSPAPNPHINKLSGCQFSGSPCNLSVTSLNGADTTDWSVLWTFNPATVTGGSGLTFSPTFPSTYSGSVTATATNAIGTGTDTMTMSIAAPPCNNPPTQGDIVIQYSGSGGCAIGSSCTANQSIRFAASSLAYKFNTNCDQYLWTFGDGTTASTQVANHTYASNGTYTGSFKITVGSATLTYPFSVSVGSTPSGGCGNNCPPQPTCPQIAEGSVFVTFNGGTSGCSYVNSVSCSAGETVSLQASPNTFNGYNFSCGSHNFTWNFGDGATGSGQQATHVYTQAGTYTPTVTVNSPTGTLSFQPEHAITIGGSSGCAIPTTSNMTIALSGSTSGCTASSPTCRASETVSFNVGSNTGYNFNACAHTFSWNFGDGGTGSGQSASHSFANVQQYTVQVTVTNASGSTTLTKIIAVNNGTTGGNCPAPTSSNVYLSYLSPNGGGCSSASPTVPCGPNEALAFAANASGYNFSCGTHTYSWSFDDGGTTTGRTPTHAFTTPRTYNVSCTITNPSGSTTVTLPVIVGTDNPGHGDAQVDFGYAPFGGTPTLIQFTPTVTPPNAASSWKWSWGDGTPDVSLSGTSATPQLHLYPATGTYTVTLTTNVGVVTKQVIVGGATTPRARPSRH